MFMNLFKKYRYELSGSFFCLLFGMLSGWGMETEKYSWYMDLAKSKLTPPNYVFPIAWSILYILLGIVIGNLWRNKKINSYRIKLFIAQFIFNLAWSPIFFKLHNVKAAFIDILIILIITLNLILSLKNKKNLILLLVPYVLWLLFAGYLNYEVLIKN